MLPFEIAIRCLCAKLFWGAGWALRAAVNVCQTGAEHGRGIKSDDAGERGEGAAFLAAIQCGSSNFSCCRDCRIHTCAVLGRCSRLGGLSTRGLHLGTRVLCSTRMTSLLLACASLRCEERHRGAGSSGS